MSHLGNKELLIPATVTIVVLPQEIQIKGKYGIVTQDLTICGSNLVITIQMNYLSITTKKNDSQTKAFQGLLWALCKNMIIGVSTLFKKVLLLEGIGYKFTLTSTHLILNIGYTHPIQILQEIGITFKLESPIKLIITGNDKQKVNSIAAKIRDIRKPECYKGKGIRYENEIIRRKVGKTGKK